MKWVWLLGLVQVEVGLWGVAMGQVGVAFWVWLRRVWLTVGVAVAGVVQWAWLRVGVSDRQLRQWPCGRSL